MIDTTLTPQLRAEGDARELQRAIQDLRRDAELELSDRIELWIEPRPASLEPFLDAIRAETLADVLTTGTAPADAATATVELDAGTTAIALRRLGRPA